MKYIALFILLSGCTNEQHETLKEENKALIKLVQQREDEIEYIGHQLMDCQNGK